MVPSDIPIKSTQAKYIGRPSLLAVFKRGAQRRAWINWYIRSGLLVPAMLLMAGLLLLLPLRIVNFSLRWMGTIAQRLSANTKFEIQFRRKIGIIDPSLCGHQIDSLLNAWWQNMGILYGRYLILNRCCDSEWTEVNDKDHIESYRRAGKRVLVSMVHLGDWEMITNAVQDLAGEADFISTYEPGPNNFLNWWIYRRRKKIGFYVFPPGAGSARNVAQLMASEETDLVMFIDEEWPDGSKFPQFGRPFAKQGNLARLARLSRKYRRPIIPAYMVRLPDGKSQINFLPEVFPTHLPLEQWEDHIKRELNVIYEPIIRANLAQWFMVSRSKFSR